MEQSNITYVTNVNDYKFGSLIEEGKKMLQDIPKASFVKNEYLILIRIKGEYNIKAFDVGVDSRLSEGPIVASLGEDESSIQFIKGKLDVRRYRARFGKKYTHSQGHFNLLIPEDKDLMYAVQELTKDKSFVQWMNHEHSEIGQEIMENGEYALFRNSNFPIPPLQAIISESGILVMGESVIGALGYYREFPATLN